MGAFDFRRPAGVWADRSAFSAEDAADFDLKLTKCLNAAEGGSWAPSDVISIDGEGVKIRSALRLGPDATFSLGGVQGVDPGFYIRATSDVNKMTYTDMPFTAVDDVTLGGGPGATNIEKVVRVYGRLLIPSSQNDSSSYVLNCAGPARFGQDAKIEAQLQTLGMRVTSGSIFEGTFNALGCTQIQLGGEYISLGADELELGGVQTTIQGPWDYGITGRMRRNSTVASSDRMNFNPAEVQWVLIPATLLTKNAVYGIQTVDLGNGDTIGFTNQSSQYDAFITNPAGDTIVQVYAQHWAHIEMVEGVLVCLAMNSMIKHGVAD